LFGPSPEYAWQPQSEIAHRPVTRLIDTFSLPIWGVIVWQAENDQNIPFSFKRVRA